VHCNPSGTSDADIAWLVRKVSFDQMTALACAYARAHPCLCVAWGEGNWWTNTVSSEDSLSRVNFQMEEFSPAGSHQASVFPEVSWLQSFSFVSLYGDFLVEHDWRTKGTATSSRLPLVSACGGPACPYTWCRSMDTEGE
jgi:hypothetical protein